MRLLRRLAHSRRVIKNAVLHPIGEQPMLADLLVRPQAFDVSLLCTNLRTIDGKRPRSVDTPEAVFIIPLATIRFAELPAHELAAFTAAAGASVQGNTNGHAPHEVNGQAPDANALVALPGTELYSVLPEGELESDLDEDPRAPEEDLFEPDEDLLRRIREV